MDDGLRIRVRAPFEKVIAWVTEALREQGFGVLTAIDVQDTLRTKGVMIERFVILGACNPSLAWQVLSIDRRLDVVPPSNVVVRVEDTHVVVDALESQALIDTTAVAALRPLAAEARRRLSTALRAVDDVALTRAGTGWTIQSEQDRVVCPQARADVP
jgi:uncharacterized protein (DUF302 family)